MNKSLIVSEARLSDMLTATGFSSAARWYGGYAWNRWNSILGLSEWLLVGFAGKNNEAVSANVGVGITRYLAFGIKHELLIELADVKSLVDKYGFWISGRGQALIESTEKARAWERQFVETAPKAAESYAREYGDELLKRTANARQRSLELLRQLDSTKSLYQQINKLGASYGQKYRKEAERLANWPGVMQVHDAEEVYLLACYSVLSGENGTLFFDQDPLRNDELMWQIQIVADGIFLAHKPQ